jgi:hypothetical protein
MNGDWKVSSEINNQQLLIRPIDLSRCYRLLKFISDGPQQIRDGFEDHIVSQGHQLTSIADMNAVLRGLIELHSKYCQVLADQLSADVPLMAAMDKAFRRLVNGNIKNIAEIIARSADLLLKTQSANESGGVLSQLDDLVCMLLYTK